MSAKKVAGPSDDDIFVLQCGNRSIVLRIEDAKDDRAHYGKFLTNLTRSAATLSRIARLAAEAEELASPQDEFALAGIECLTDLAAGIAERIGS